MRIWVGNCENMKSKVSEKERAIEKRIAERFALTHVHVQPVSCPGENDQLLQIDFSDIGDRMTVGGLRRFCNDISAEVGGTLYGTVNLDYSGDIASAEMMVELEL